MPTADSFPPLAPAVPYLGSAQHEIFFSVMKIIHRQPPTALATSDKVARLSCCCRLSELLPLVRQLHDEARARAARPAADQQQQAA